MFRYFTNFCNLPQGAWFYIGEHKAHKINAISYSITENGATIVYDIDDVFLLVEEILI